MNNLHLNDYWLLSSRMLSLLTVSKYLSFLMLSSPINIPFPTYDSIYFIFIFEPIKYNYCSHIFLLFLQQKLNWFAKSKRNKINEASGIDCFLAARWINECCWLWAQRAICAAELHSATHFHSLLCFVIFALINHSHAQPFAHSIHNWGWLRNKNINFTLRLMVKNSLRREGRRAKRLVWWNGNT